MADAHKHTRTIVSLLNILLALSSLLSLSLIKCQISKLCQVAKTKRLIRSLLYRRRNYCLSK